MGSPYFILGTGQSNMAAQPAYSWSPSNRAKVWNNVIDDDTSIGSAYNAMSGSNVNIAWRYGSKIAEADPAKDVYVAVYARNGRDISYWFGGCQYAYPGLGAGQMALSSTPEVTTQIFVSTVDIFGIRRPYTLADLRVGEYLFVKQGGSFYTFRINGVATSDANGATVNVSYVSGSGGLNPGTVQVEFQPRFLYEIENSVPAALAAAGTSSVDLVMWWQGESDAENNTSYNTEFEFVIGYLQQKPWWRADTKLLICGMNSTANNGIPTSDTQNARFASLAAASSNRYFMNTAAQLQPGAWADVYHMTPIGYAAAGDLAMSVYSPPLVGGGGGGGGATITSMSCGPSQVIMDIKTNPAHQFIGGGYGLWVDGTPHPYRDHTGATFLMLKHSENYRFRIPSWSNPAGWLLEGPVMLSARQAPEGLYNNRHWLFGLWCEGANISGITHHEWYHVTYTASGIPGFNGNNITGNPADFNTEWVNSIAHATSTNGGASFQISSYNDSRRLVIVPEPWDIQSAKHAYGFFHPSNIAKEGNYHYLMVEQRSIVDSSIPGSINGMSILRTLDVTTPLNWEFWNGSSWIVIDHMYYQGNRSTQVPYRFFEKFNNFAQSNAVNSSMGLNLRYHVPTQQWLVFGAAGDTPNLFGYTASKTLANPQFNTVVGIPNPNPGIFNPAVSVFDETATDQNFINIGNTLTVYTVESGERISKSTLTISVSATSSPTYSVAPAATSVNEGSTVGFNVSTSSVSDGTVLYWTNAGTTNSADFTDGVMSGSFTVSSNSGYFSRTLVNDATTEGPETIVVQLRTGSTSGTVVATAATVTVNDTSVPATPTYAVTPTASSVNEGSSVTFNISTTNVANGTLYWTNAGTTNSADFTDGLNSGSFSLTSNAGSVARTLVNDTSTEGAETIILQVRTGSTAGTIVATSSPVTVNDTSTGTVPSYAVTPSTSSVNEGASVTFNVSTINVANGTSLYWTNAGTSVGADFTDGLNSGVFTISANSGSFVRSLVSDALTEGPETLVIQIRTSSTAGTIVATAATVTINDTSTTPVASNSKLCFRAPQGTWLNAALVTALKVRTSTQTWLTKTPTLAGVRVRNAANNAWLSFVGATYAVTPSSSTVNAGSSVTFTVTTTNFGTGTLYWETWGTTTNTDFTDNAMTGTVSIVNNSGSFTRSLATTATNAHTIIMKIRTGSSTGPVVATASTVIISGAPVAPSALTMNRNDLDFYYAPTVTPTASGYLDIRATVDTSAFFNYASGPIDHIVFAFDCTGGQGSYNPHCGPIMRNGRNLWALARGVLLTRGGDIVVEEWNGTFSPYTAVIPNTIGGALNVLSGVFTIRIRAGYIQSSSWTNQIYVTVHAGASIYDTAIFQGTANGRNFNNLGGPSSVAIGAISMGFVNPSDTGCVEKTGAGPAYGGNLPFTLDPYAY